MSDLINSASFFSFPFFLFFRAVFFRIWLFGDLDNKKVLRMNNNQADSVPGSSAADFIASQIVFPVMIAQRSHSTKRGFPFCYVPWRR
ncbi:hypothetical protein LFZ20_00120 [Salmonella enterica subsp. enterica serovar Johannesburg str. SA20025782]|nr:hypothetical protein LFZ20_00120 [Salmonella enterica subsp. enterica serovar Johannesburg str. SA20025782]